jgi:flotillin
MVVLNGADGVADLLTKALAMGGTGLGLARTLLSSMSEKQVPEQSPNGATSIPSPEPRTP